GRTRRSACPSAQPRMGASPGAAAPRLLIAPPWATVEPLMLGLLSPLPWRRWLTATIAATAATAALQACVLYDQEGPTSTQLYALIDAHCRSATECGCGFAGPDPDTCVPELEARWKVRAEQAQQRGLRYDAACLAGLTAEIESYGCYWPGGPSPLCETFRAVLHGDRA